MSSPDEAPKLERGCWLVRTPKPDEKFGYSGVCLYLGTWNGWVKALDATDRPCWGSPGQFELLKAAPLAFPTWTSMCTPAMPDTPPPEPQNEQHATPRNRPSQGFP